MTPPMPPRKEFELSVTVECHTSTATVEVTLHTCENNLQTYLVEKASMFGSNGFFERKNPLPLLVATERMRQYSAANARAFINAMIGAYYYNT